MFGINVYSKDGENVLRLEELGAACFKGIATAESTPLNGINPDWVWLVPSSIQTSEENLFAFNQPSFLCYIKDGKIVKDNRNGELQVFWGIA